MATASDRRDSSVRPPGSKYPWSDWQDGRWWTIRHGEDFHCELKTMRDQLHVRAKTTNTYVKTYSDKIDRVTFVFSGDGEPKEKFLDRVGTP